MWTGTGDTLDVATAFNNFPAHFRRTFLKVSSFSENTKTLPNTIKTESCIITAIAVSGHFQIYNQALHNVPFSPSLWAEQRTTTAPTKW